MKPARALPIGLVVLLVLVVLIRSPSDPSRSIGAAEGEATEAPASTVAPTPPEVFEPPVEPFVRSGCFRNGSSRAEVRAVMGPADTVDRGAWVYGGSWVTFGYGVALDFSNEGGDLRLCEPAEADVRGDAIEA